MNKLEELKAELAELVKHAKAGTLTAEQGERFDALKGEIEAEKARLKRIADGEQIVKGLSQMTTEDADEDADQKGGAPKRAKSVGAHFVQHLKGTGKSLANPGTVHAPEYKAATDTHVIGRGGVQESAGYGPLTTDVDTEGVSEVKRTLTVADLLSSGPISGNAISYPVYPALEGTPGFVGEAGQKPQFHLPEPTWRTDALGEVAGWFAVSDDLAEDHPALISEINTEGLYALNLAEENDLLFGPGTGNRLSGILNRSGIQTETAANEDDLAEALFRAITKVRTGSGRAADGIVINPLDYERLRLSKDGNGQYFGGGIFSGQYGNGSLLEEPGVWARRTVVTEAVPQGRPVVGAFASAKVFRKGGIRIESTNSHADDFTNDRITIRLRERLGLQVKRPAAFVQVSIAAAAGGEG